MRNCVIWVSLCLVLAGASTASAADRTSFGLGFGTLYNGLGANLAWTAQNDMKFVALGCSGFSHSTHDGTDVVCGVGAGWLRSDILTRKNNKHGLGLSIALDYSQLSSGIEAVLRLPYVFFFKGIDQKGLNLGIAPSVRWTDKSTDFAVMIQIGYQF